MNPYVLANISIAVAVVAWGLAPVAIRYLSTDYEPFTQGFLRYLSATVTVLVLGAVFRRRDIAAAFRQWAPLSGVAAFNAVGMVCWTLACYRTTATTAQLVTKLSLVFVILLSYLLFHEERRVIRNPRFILGTLMGMLGVAAVLVKNPSASLLPNFDLAAVLLMLVAALWAGYAISAKHMVTDLNPAAMFAVVGLYTTLLLAVLAVVFERPVTLAASTPWVTFIAVASGVIPIALGHSTYHYAQKHLGAAYCSSMLLIMPFVANAAGVLLWEDEYMTWVQWLGAAILLSGSYLVIRAGYGVRRVPPE